MEFFEKNKKVLLFVGIFALLGVGYFLFFSGDSTGTANVSIDPTAGGLISELSMSPADAIIGRDLLTMLIQLKSITLDISIFSDPAFASLQDQSRPITPEPFGKVLGRRNPFADFAKGGTATSSAGSAPAVSPGALSPSVR